MKRYPYLPFLFTLMTIIGCGKCSHEKIETVVLVENPEQVNEEVSNLIGKQLSDFDTSLTFVIEKDSLLATKLMFEFYRENKFNVIWTDKGICTRQGDSLLTLIKNSDEYGLIPADYHVEQIENLINTEKDNTTNKIDAIKISKADMLLTDAFFTFAINVKLGRLNVDSLIREWKLAQLIAPSPSLENGNSLNLVSILNNAIEQNSIRSAIDSLEPKTKQYQALKSALKNFKFEFRNSDWDSIAPREADSLTFNKRLKKRLIASHDYAEILGDSDSIKLVKAIKNFQCRHNLTEDGKIGKLTFKALQLTKQDYIRQIEMNLERWRYYYAPYEKQFVWVNIPKYEMRVYEEDTLVMKSRVIVGAPEHRTPILKSTIRYFLIYPYWTVPFSIATKEILPILKHDTSYLRKKNFDVLDAYGNVYEKKINWKKYSKTYFPWRLRQRMGEDNSLGVLKFNFENKYGVYLHDTNGHRLFKKEMRALSHGCVRLERFFDFATFLIREDKPKSRADKHRYTLDSLKMDLLKEEQKYVYIKHPIPIYINYFTTEVEENNELFFFIDVYQRDEKMLKALGH